MPRCGGRRPVGLTVASTRSTREIALTHSVSYRTFCGLRQAQPTAAAVGWATPKGKTSPGGRKVNSEDTQSKVILCKIVHDFALGHWHIVAMPKFCEPSRSRGLPDGAIVLTVPEAAADPTEATSVSSGATPCCETGRAGPAEAWLRCLIKPP
jgi:hypothetical protein